MAAGADQSGETPPPDAAPARRVRRLGRIARIALVVALVLIVALIAVWTQRKPIATRFIASELARRDVRARYGVSDLALGRQRLTNVVIGDPAAPDLVADWLESETHVGLDGASVTGIRAGHVRLRGRLVDGRLSLGEIDKLLGPPSGKPSALPRVDLRVEDARMRLETPVGVVGLKASGRGRLDDGFAGQVAAVADRLASGDCAASGVRAALRVRIADGAPRLTGPVQIARARCAGVGVARAGADLDVTLASTLDRWRGTATLATGAVRNATAEARALRGTIAFDGNAAATGGTVDLAATAVRAPGVGAATTAAVQGDYRVGATQGFAGDVRVVGAQAAPALLARLDPHGAGRGTPFGPLIAAAGTAVRRAGQDFQGQANLVLRSTGGRGQVRVERASLRSASGARVALAGGSGLWFGWPGNRLRIDTRIAMAGGGLPTGTIAVAQARAGAPISGEARLAPYAAGGARLALTPVRFAEAGGATRITTRATLSGPLGDGRVEALTVPLDLRWDGRGVLAVNPGCVPLSIQRLAVAGLTLDPLATRLCPVAGAMLTLGRGGIAGGVRLPATTLTGRLGQTPLTLTAKGAALRLGDRGFVLDGVTTRIGGPDRVSRIDIGTLTGRIAADGAVAGTFAAGAGQIGNVPLLLAGAAGDWTLRGGALDLTGTMTVSDAAAAPRFQTLDARGVTLRLVGGAIDARGVLYEPSKNVKVADVRIDHALGSGRGSADIAVPGIAFTEAFQPDLLTRLTFGVVADVRGSVAGDGHIVWGPDGVTSTGTFGTKDMALAAAFGPVTGLSTTIRFTDLLNMASAPGQVATIGTVNPGIQVAGGTIVYQLLPGNRVQIDSGRWPFAGGTMALLPTTLDFSTQTARRLTFRLTGVEADHFLEQFDFKNLAATGVFDGELPMVFDVDGGRIESGRLVVRPGGGTIAYVGDLTQKDLGLWGNIAFQALKSLRYRNLTIGMNGPLAGEMVTDVRFAGVTQGQGAKSNFIVRKLQRLPFVFNIRIKAPFRGLLDSALNFYDPKRLIRQQQLVPTVQPTTTTHIQPPASRTVP